LGLGGAVEAQAQDTIIKNDKSEISAKVIEITEEHIKYRLFDFLDGPLYNVRKTDVWMIIYEKGRREKFNVPETAASTPAPAPAAVTVAAAPAAPVPVAPAPAAVAPVAAVPDGAPSTPAPPPSAAEATPATPAAETPATTVATAATPTSTEAAPAPVAPAPADPTPGATAAAPAPQAAPAAGGETVAAPAPAPAVAAEAPVEAAPAAAPATPAAAEAPAAPAAAPEAAATPAPAPVVARPQRRREPAAEAAPGQVIWTKLGNGPAPVKYINTDGNILILKANFVMSLDKNTGKQLWLTKVERTKSATLLGDGTLIQVMAGSASTDYLQAFIIDSETGKVVYSPPAAKQVENRVVDAANIVVWEATEAGSRAVVLDKVSGARRAEQKVAPGLARPLRILLQPDGQVVVVSSYGVTALDAATGRLGYNVALKRSARVAELLPPTEPTFELFETAVAGQVCVLKDGYLSGVNLRTGQLTGEQELPGAVVSYQEIGREQLVIGKSGRKDKDLTLGVYDKATGLQLRSSTLPISNAGAMQPVGNDLFVVGGGSTVKLVDLRTLTLKADKTFKNSGDNVQLFANERGIGLLSTGGVEYFNPQDYAATGKTKYFDPAGRAKLKVDDDTYFLANGYLGRVNLKKGEEALLLKDKLPLKLLSGEVPQLELLDDGLAVVTAQSVAKIDFRGSIVYQQYFTPPLVVAGAILGQTAAQTLDSAPKAGTVNLPKQAWITHQRAFETGTVGVVHAGRPNTVLRHHIVLTKADKDELGRFKLLKINKVTGKVEGQVEVENRTPDYIFDPVDSVVYLFDVDSVKAYKI
jgi:outer membrane protein assembly factor BamB